MTAAPNAPDLVVRLRRQCTAICDEAANEIERLRRITVEQRRSIAGERKRRREAETGSLQHDELAGAARSEHFGGPR